MKSLVVLLLASTACDGGASSDPMADAAGALDAASDSPSSMIVTDHEPNDERVEATQFPAGGGTFVVHGTCKDSSDLDYYDVHPSMLGPYALTLEWQAGAYQIVFDPEDGLAGSKSKSMMPPISASGTVTSTPAQFGIDCYNDGNPSGLTGLAYTLHITLP